MSEPLYPAATARRRRADGFTLVELLVVIAIIGILAGLISVAAVNSLWRSKQAAIKIEVDLLDAAFKDGKNKWGLYPPANLVISTTSDPTSGGYNQPLRQFISKAFPRYNQANLRNDLMVAGVDVDNFNPASALVFWLSGFNPDPQHPFTSSTPPYNTPYTGSRTPLFAFDKTRLRQLDGSVAPDGTPPAKQIYVPNNGQGVPYVYFDYRSYTLTSPVVSSGQPVNPNVNFTALAASAGNPQPYALDVNEDKQITLGTDTWANPDSFQIISAGQDGSFGATMNSPAAKLFPAGLNYATEDNDNITNFYAGAALEDAKP